MQVVYLVRHGAAKPKEEDPQRGLTTAGQEIVQQMANRAASVGIRVDQIRHSGKLRAEQTARMFATALQPGVEPQAMQGLNPNDDVRPVAEVLASETRTLMLVGHLPFLGRLVSQLVIGDPDQNIVAFAAAGLVRLSKSDEGWVIDCVVQPDSFP
jgi:phosphohistidine phosphatase